ncbi:hypothetical protein PVK06_045283 [Gossypium arboreum]|uniref:Uncharacterized protein n=1 Tax=Gossypium arboreum TaxID=29729 RepID=A0ABR0MTM3_GOSAR|nr:hypothetical protein PVK06_045283 [Gossypium arboreum]
MPGWCDIVQTISTRSNHSTGKLERRCRADQTHSGRAMTVRGVGRSCVGDDTVGHDGYNNDDPTVRDDFLVIK